MGINLQCHYYITVLTLQCPTMGWYLVYRECNIADLNNNKTTPNGKFPTISSRSWVERRANIDWTLCVALELPQQMFFFGRFHCPVYFELLHHLLEVKGLRMERVVWEVGEGEERRWSFLWASRQWGSWGGSRGSCALACMPRVIPQS